MGCNINLNGEGRSSRAWFEDTTLLSVVERVGKEENQCAVISRIEDREHSSSTTELSLPEVRVENKENMDRTREDDLYLTQKNGWHPWADCAQIPNPSPPTHKSAADHLGLLTEGRQRENVGIRRIVLCIISSFHEVRFVVQQFPISETCICHGSDTKPEIRSAVGNPESVDQLKQGS